MGTLMSLKVVMIYLGFIIMQMKDSVHGMDEQMMSGSNLPCPNPEDIKPCVCSFDVHYEMTMDCSNVTSRKELKEVFSHQFTYNAFRYLNIRDNSEVSVLREGDFGNSSFIKIYLERTNINEIEDLAFSGSFDTVDILYVRSCPKLQSLPDLSPFKRLFTLYFYESDLTTFPSLTSASVYSLHLDGHAMETIPVDAFSGLPSLESIQLQRGSISQIIPETFTHINHLTYVDLSDNKLTSIPDRAIQLQGTYGDIRLSGNQISHVSPGSFAGIVDRFFMSDNNLSELDEDVWRPILEGVDKLTLSGNPFACGCDIAWLITNQTLLDHLLKAEDPTCSSGDHFSALDPGFYQAMC